MPQKQDMLIKQTMDGGYLKTEWAITILKTNMLCCLADTLATLVAMKEELSCPLPVFVWVSATPPHIHTRKPQPLFVYQEHLHSSQ